MRHRTPKIGPGAEGRALARARPAPVAAPAPAAIPVRDAVPIFPSSALTAMIYDPTRHVVVGRSGSGKSYTGRAIFATLEEIHRRAGIPFRPIVFDHLQKWKPEGFGKVDASGTFVAGAFVMNELELMLSLERQRELMNAGDLTPFPIVVGVVIREWRGLDQAWFASIFTDEARLYADPWAADKDIRAIRDVLCMGRHVKQDWCFMTQRPAHLHGDVFANASHGWIHPLGNHNDRAAVERGLDVSLAGAVWRPAPHQGAYYPLRWTLERGLVTD